MSSNYWIYFLVSVSHADDATMAKAPGAKVPRVPEDAQGSLLAHDCDVETWLTDGVDRSVIVRRAFG